MESENNLLRLTNDFKERVDGEYDREWAFQSDDDHVTITFTPSLKAVDPETGKYYELTFQKETLTLDYNVLNDNSFYNP